MTSERRSGSPTRWLPSGGLSLHEKIDVCRGLLAYLVVSAHGLEMTWSMAPSGPDRLRGLPRALLGYGAGTGIYWVMGFFVISGYCICLSARRLIQKDGFALGTYLLARLTRIAPLYYIALVFAAAVEWWIVSDRPDVWPHGLNLRVFSCQVLLLQNFTETFGSYAPSWSITNEIFYYVFYGLLVCGMSKSCRKPATIGMLVCLATGFLSQLWYRLGYRSSSVMHVGLLFGLGINWFLGALVAEHREWLAKNRQVGAITRLWPIALISSIAMWCSQRIHLEFVYASSGVAFTLMLARFVITEDRRRAASTGDKGTAWPIATMLGTSSYPTYLFHGPLLMLSGWMILHWRLNLDWRVIWALSSGVAISGGILLGYLAERPIMARRAAWLKSFQSSDRPRFSSRINVVNPWASRLGARAWRSPS